MGSAGWSEERKFGRWIAHQDADQEIKLPVMCMNFHFTHLQALSRGRTELLRPIVAQVQLALQQQPGSQ
jgi:hypothetical protein